MVAAELAEAAHARRQAEQPGHYVEVVQALVEQHAAAFAAPGRAPAAAGVVRFGAEPIGDDPAQADDVAQFAALNQFADFQVTGFDPKLKHGGKYLVRIFFGNGDQSFGIGFVGGNRFLDHQMQTGFERSNSE